METISETQNRRQTWEFSTLLELHAAANTLLRQAMLNERYKRWKKVIDLYQELVWMIDLERFPSDYEPPSIYYLLLYELYFHMGVAFQHLNNHTEAIAHFSKTIEVASIAKNGCLAGCLTNSCLMTPIHARRAFAYAKLGYYKEAIKDAEKAVVLDSGSPDVYCIRALVRSTFDDELMGLKDLEDALKLDPHHVCSTMLKASFTKPLFTGDTEKHTQYKILREEAIRLCEEAETYLNCNSFTHPCIVEFYDKFLFPLCVPHTITRIHLTPEKPTKKQLESKQTDTVTCLRAGSSPPTTSTSRSGVQSVAPSSDIFRCGTTNVATNNRTTLKRRTDYGNAVQKYVSRPKSAQEFFALLEKQRMYEKKQKRAQSALIRPGERFAHYQSTPNSGTQQPAKPAVHKELNHLTVPDGGQVAAPSPIRGWNPEKSHQSSVASHPEQENVEKENEDIVKPLRPTATRKKILIEAPKDYCIPVFQSVNVKSAPRMYYKPWGGDKLPVVERTNVKNSPVFY